MRLALTASVGPILKGHATNAPAYCCGNCGAVLIEGVYSSQFINADECYYSGADSFHPVALTPEEQIISKALPVRDDGCYDQSEWAVAVDLSWLSVDK